ncbi:MAG TPA: hypothetical protein VF581_09030 [Flavobacterium sp.]|jgi:hypothetical protein
MKTLKRIVVGILILFSLSSVVGYFYFEQKFTPDPNYLNVRGSSGTLSIKWQGSLENPTAALLLPVKLKGIQETFYMQLDFGSPNTIFYGNALASLETLYPSAVRYDGPGQNVDLAMTLGEMQITSKIFDVIDYGDSLDHTNQDKINIIGTIGTDLLEKRVAIIDFPNSSCRFSNEVATEERVSSDFEFDKRRILLHGVIDNEPVELLYDSGASAYSLITNEKIWEKYAIPGSKDVITTANSWGTTLTVHTRPTSKRITFGGTALQLSDVTYIDGTTFVQNILMRFSGMEGMVGNKLFADKTIFIDCKNKKFAILE